MAFAKFCCDWVTLISVSTNHYFGYPNLVFSERFQARRMNCIYNNWIEHQTTCPMSSKKSTETIQKDSPGLHIRQEMDAQIRKWRSCYNHYNYVIIKLTKYRHPTDMSGKMCGNYSINESPGDGNNHVWSVIMNVFTKIKVNLMSGLSGNVWQPGPIYEWRLWHFLIWIRHHQYDFLH